MVLNMPFSVCLTLHQSALAVLFIISPSPSFAVKSVGNDETSTSSFFQPRNIRFLTRQIYIANKSVQFKMLRAYTTCTERLPFSAFVLNKIDPALASFNRLWSRIPFIRNLMKNYSIFWIRSVRTANKPCDAKAFAVIRLAKQ